MPPEPSDLQTLRPSPGRFDPPTPISYIQLPPPFPPTSNSPTFPSLQSLPMGKAGDNIYHIYTVCNTHVHSPSSDRPSTHLHTVEAPVSRHLWEAAKVSPTGAGRLRE